MPGCSSRISARRAQPLVGVRRRHADVDDRDVGLVGADLAQQVLGVAGLGDDLEARLLEQARDALAQQHAVVGEDDAHGTSALTVVPSPGRRVDLEAPVERREAVGEAAQAGAAPRIGAADAVVADLDHGVEPLSRATRTAAVEAPAYLATLVSASATTK